MRQLQKGMYARSLAGHDKGRLYIILEEMNDTVSLSDGRLRTIDRPKIKNRKHVQIDHTVSSVISERLEQQKPLRDEDIRKALKEKEKTNTQEEEKHTCQRMT